MSNLLINDYPLMVSPKLAARIGLEEATFVQQIHWLCEKRINIRDGLSWVYNTYDQWLEMFPFFENEQRVGRIVRRLEKLGVLVTTKKYNKLPLDKRKWYRVNYDSDVLDFSASNLNDETSNLNDETSNLKEQYTQTSSIDFQHRLSSGCDPLCAFASETAADVGLVEDRQPENAVVADTQPEILPADKPKKSSNPANAQTWQAYRQAYLQRYGIEPLRNAQTNALIANLVKSVGGQEAPQLVAYYLTHNGYYFVRERHSLKALIASLQAIRTDWLTGQQMTQTQAKQTENTQSNFDTLQRVLAMREAQRQAGGN
jgi:hypothetical protein